MVTGLNMDVEVSVLPTVREPDGLAMSSRNAYLNADERRAAAVLSRHYRPARELINAGVREAEKVRAKMRAVLLQEKGIVIDYAEVADPETLAPVEIVNNGKVLLVAARREDKID